MLSTIPFSGFYDSLHSDAIDQAEQYLFTDRDTGCERNEGLEMRLYYSCNYSAVQLEYAKEYAERFGLEFEIKLQFESMESPREYNFSTDQIYVTISESEVHRLYALCDSQALAELAKQQFTSRSGFISFYSPCIADWGAVATWDHNQVGTLLECIAGTDFDCWGEFELMDSALGNSAIESWIIDNTPDMPRLYRVFDYLETRKHRDHA
jgi:hypothetical protein